MGFLIRTISMLLLLGISLPAACADSFSDSALENGSSSETNDADESFDVHVYISNQDDDRQKVSLFIDSDLKASKEISSKSETKIDSYPLTGGLHRFEITWWDDDTKRSYREESVVEVQNETSVNLYTIRNEDPEKFDVNVKVENKNDKKIDAYLYVDGNFEKSKEMQKSSIADMGTIKVEEGDHEFCIRWRDPDTRIEYEKRQRLTVEGDEVVSFYTPQGLSFQEGAKRAFVPETRAAFLSSQTSTEDDDGELALGKAKSSNSSERSSQSSFHSSSQSSFNSSYQGRSSSGSNASTKAKEMETITAEGPGPSGQSWGSQSSTMYIYVALAIFALYLLFKK
ncbi:MAG: hypothetical protein JW986_07475 [Methanotrichaceae archaeon]|nr:hypothetical protein [Methanotrichaceae archaeon]